MKINYGLHIFRILCYMGVLVYHIFDDIVFNDTGNTAGEFIYFSASYCIPGFFLMSGYLIASHQTVTIEYCEKKIKTILTKLFGWIVFFSVLNYILYTELLNPFEHMIFSLTAQGILPLAWFIFTYCIILIVASFLFHALKIYPILYCISGWLLIIALAFGFAHRLNNKPQVLWFHLYLGYFIFGMTILKIQVYLNKRMAKKKQQILFLSTFLLSGVVYILQVMTRENFMLPEAYYGKWYYSIWLFSLFFFLCNIEIKRQVTQKIIVLFSKNSLVVYLGHLPILTIITSKYHELNTLGDCFIMLFCLFIFLQIQAEIFKRLPLLRKLI